MPELDKKGQIFLGRRFGASPEARERMDAFNAEQVFWGECRFCRQRLEGTPAQLVKAMGLHKCRADFDG